MSQPEFPPARRTGSNYTVGIMFMLMGALVIAIGFGLIHPDPSAIHAPRWVLAIFGGLFILVGVWSIIRNVIGENSSRAGGINFVFALLVMLAITVICLWVGFGPGERLFVQDVGIGIDPATRPVDPTAGRIFFCIFGVLMAGVTVALAVIQGGKLLAGGTKPS